MEPRLVEAVASEHAAHSIADELLGHCILVPGNTIICYINLCLLKDGDFIQWNIRSQLVLQAIDVDELAVELFLVLMQLHKLALPFRLVLLHAPFQTA